MEVITSGDIVGLVSTAMAAIASAEACEAYCVAIGRVCTDVGEDRLACGADIITAMLAMMKAHPASKGVLSAACGALSGLVEGNADNAVRIVASGGLERVYAAMKAHRASEPVQQSACSVLLRLAENAECAGRMRTGEAAVLLRYARIAHPNDSSFYRGPHPSVRALLWLEQPEVRACLCSRVCCGHAFFRYRLLLCCSVVGMWRASA